MKTRIVTAAVGIPLLLVLDFLAPLWGFGLAIALVSGGAAFEMMRCARPEAAKRLILWPVLSAALLPLAVSLKLSANWAIGIAFLLFFLLFCELMLSFRQTKPVSLDTVAVALMAGAVMPLMLASILRLGLDESVGRACMLLPFITAFACDAGAYFAGKTLGKHKLAPRLSPNKTVEGAVGGLLSATVITALYGLVLQSQGLRANLALLLIYGAVGGVASQLGDLSFSAIKRLCGVKDFGKILPGHGGMLDRFDSMYYLAPLFELLMLVAPAIGA